MAPSQLALPFPHAPHYDAADFLEAGSNAGALAWLARPADWPLGRLVLWGEAGRGKTHLLHVFAARIGATILSGATLATEPPTTAIVLDDADAAPEEALLHMMNACAEARLLLLMSGRAAPSRWVVALPDLASRLRAAASVELAAPEESLLRALLARLLAERQLAVPATLQDWLLLRLPRTPAAIREAAARLDALALAQGGRVTRALASGVLAEIGEWLQPDEVASSVEPASRPGPALL